VLNQNVSPNEIIIIDDGSTDGGGDLVKNKYKDKIQYIKIENVGVSAARNLGVKLAKNNYIAFLDADDEWLPDHLRDIISLIAKYPEADAYASAYKLCYEKLACIDAKINLPLGFGVDGILNNYFELSAKGNNPMWTSAVCVRKEPFFRFGGFPERVEMREDLYLWAHFVIFGSVAYSSVSSSIYYKNTENSVCVNHKYTRQDIGFKRIYDSAIAEQKISSSEAYWAVMHVNKYVLLNSFKALVSGCSGQARSILIDLRPLTAREWLLYVVYIFFSFLPDIVLNVGWRIFRSVKLKLLGWFGR
jgi:glycosyltransferase involved in cell wall biosynthesis